MRIGHIRITDFKGVRKFQMTPAKVWCGIKKVDSLFSRIP